MRIGFLNRRRDYPGGDMIAMDATMKALQHIGLDAVETDDLASVDLCHLFHCNFDWSYKNYQAIKAAGKRYVLTPIFYPQIRGEYVNEIILGADWITPFSRAELAEIPVIGLYTGKIECIPNGTDSAFYGVNGGGFGVLMVAARGKDDKQIPAVTKLVELAGLPLRVVSGLPHEDLPIIYKQARLFIQPSDSERMSLTIGEALCAGCRVMATNKNRGNSWYGSGLYQFEPGALTKEQVAYAYQTAEWDYTANIIAKILTWDMAAVMLMDVYRQVLGC